MKKKIIRIGTKRKPKLKSGERVKPLQLTKQLDIIGTETFLRMVDLNIKGIGKGKWSSLSLTLVKS